MEVTRHWSYDYIITKVSKFIKILFHERVAMQGNQLASIPVNTSTPIPAHDHAHTFAYTTVCPLMYIYAFLLIKLYSLTKMC